MVPPAYRSVVRGRCLRSGIRLRTEDDSRRKEAECGCAWDGRGQAVTDPDGYRQEWEDLQSRVYEVHGSGVRPAGQGQKRRAGSEGADPVAGAPEQGRRWQVGTLYWHFKNSATKSV